MEGIKLSSFNEEEIYQNALQLSEGALYREAAKEFGRIPDYKDALERKAACEQSDENARKDEIYADADKAAANSNVKSQQKAIKLFRQIPGWRDADERILRAENRIEELLIQGRKDREEAMRLADERRIATAKRRKRILICAAIAAVIIAVCIVGSKHYNKFTVPEKRYQSALAKLEKGETDEAYRLLKDMKYGDSDKRLFGFAKERLGNAEVGSTVLFGSYEQNGNRADGEEYIEWLVLDRDGSKRLLISKYALDCKPYQELFAENGVTWDSCTLRSWLNGAFMNAAFSAGEQQLIRRTRVKADPNPSYDIDVGKDSFDKVFLLSISEVIRYFPTESDRLCSPTKYAITRFAYSSSQGGYCWWWLRTIGPEINIERAAGIGTNGEIIDMGHSIYSYGYSVRPVIWIDLDAEWSGENPIIR